MRFWRRVPSLISTIFLLAGVASGCNDRVWDFGVQVREPDGGAVDATRTDGARDHNTPDLTGFGGSGGSINIGGRGGGSDAGGTGGTGGGVVMCDNNAPERQSDISNCGTCFHSCLV